jgi:hypothetical protein
MVVTMTDLQITHSSPEGVVALEDWVNLAIELAIGDPPTSEVANAYGTTPETLQWMVANLPAFAAEMKRAEKLVKETGPDAGFILRAKYLATKHLRTLDDIVSDVDTHPGIRAKGFETLARLARYEPAKDAAGPQVAVQINLDPAGLTKVKQ